MNFGFVGLLLMTVFVHSTHGKDKYVRGCYFTNWSQYRSGIWKFTPEHIEADLCSHIFYAFSSMGEDFKIKHSEANDFDLFARVNSIKEKQKDLKTLLSFGGFLFSQSSGPLIRKMLNDVGNRKIFIDSAIEFVRLHKFDGFDFNWFPEADTKVNFGKLVKEFREAIEKEVRVSAPLLLTVGLPPQIDRIKAGFDGKILAESVDWMNVMSFDYHGSWENKTGFNTPIFDRDGDGLSINSTFPYLIEKQGVPKNRLVVGLPTYGHGWKLPSTSSPNSIPSPAEGPSPAQPFTKADGTAAYFEICSLIEKEKYVEQFDDVQKASFIFKDGVWIGYNNQRSYEFELLRLIENNIRGAFVWSLDMDDFLGHCSSSNGTYPLIKTVKSKLIKK